MSNSAATISYPGLIAAWSAEGKTNQDSDRHILRDLTGNGHDLDLNGFAFNNTDSGYSVGRKDNFLDWDTSSQEGFIIKVHMNLLY